MVVYILQAFCNALMTLILSIACCRSLIFRLSRYGYYNSGRKDDAQEEQIQSMVGIPDNITGSDKIIVALDNPAM